MDKTRTTAFRPQSNPFVERMNRTLQSMLAKCINEEQSNWSQQLPYVMMAYRTSIHESTGYTSHFLVAPLISCTQAQSINLQPTSTSLCQPEKSSFKRHTIRPEWPSISIKRRNAVYSRKVHGPTYQVDEKVLLHNPVVPVGKSHKFFTPWNGPYVILQGLNDVTYRIQDIGTQKD